jgi:predicted metal-binding protein
MVDKQSLEQLFLKHGFDDYKWIKAREIEVRQWVRFRCIFGCPSYGKTATCPPHVPSIAECREFISEYDEAVIFRFQKAVERPEERYPWSREMGRKLCELEREIFLAGCYKTFLLHFDSCKLCAECGEERQTCRNPKTCRPGADALGIDVYAAVRKVGYPIQVLKDYTETMNRYAFLLLE